MIDARLDYKKFNYFKSIDAGDIIDFIRRVKKNYLTELKSLKGPIPWKLIRKQGISLLKKEVKSKVKPIRKNYYNEKLLNKSNDV